jgi:hypothetical protein
MAPARCRWALIGCLVLAMQVRRRNATIAKDQEKSNVRFRLPR